MPRHGWWTENSLVDRVDKAISLLIFTLELGAPAELLLTYPGTWFGLPTSAWGLVPMALTWYSEFRALPGSAEWFSPASLAPETVAGVQSTLTELGLGSWTSAEFALLGLIPTTIWALAHARYLLKGQFVQCYLSTKYLVGARSVRRWS
jgi:hypothetical protein